MKKKEKSTVRLMSKAETSPTPYKILVWYGNLIKVWPTGCYYKHYKNHEMGNISLKENSRKFVFRYSILGNASCDAWSIRSTVSYIHTALNSSHKQCANLILTDVT